MIDVYYLKAGNLTFIPNKFDAALPLHLREKLENIKHPKIASEKRKLLYLLNQILKTYYPKINLVDLYYNEIGKPFLSNNLNISNAYSDNVLAIALSVNNFIGLDIERVLPVNLADYQFYFTKNEWGWINNDLIKFYILWTKKEAFSKALGIGMDLAFNEIDLLKDEIVFDERRFNFTVKIIEGDYIISVVSHGSHEITFKEMNY